MKEWWWWWWSKGKFHDLLEHNCFSHNTCKTTTYFAYYSRFYITLIILCTCTLEYLIHISHCKTLGEMRYVWRIGVCPLSTLSSLLSSCFTAFVSAVIIARRTGAISLLLIAFLRWEARLFVDNCTVCCRSKLMPRNSPPPLVRSPTCFAWEMLALSIQNHSV